MPRPGARASSVSAGPRDLVPLLRARPMTAQDAGRVTTLLQEVETVDRTGEHYDVADVLEELADERARPGDRVVVELDTPGRPLVARWALIPRAPADGALAVMLDGAVHPDYRGRGIGSVTVPAMVARGVAHVGEVDAALLPVLTLSTPSDNADQADLLVASGFEPRRWSFQMVADLGSDTPAPDPLPAGLRLSAFPHAPTASIDGAASEALREAHNDAFRDLPDFTAWDEPMWRQWVTGSRAFRPDLTLLAHDDRGAIAGYVQTSAFEATYAATGVREAYVAKVGTLRPWRSRGLAGSLLRHALRAYAAAGFERAALDVDSENPTGALGVYERAGFRVDRRWTTYRREGS